MDSSLPTIYPYGTVALTELEKIMTEIKEKSK